MEQDYGATPASSRSQTDKTRRILRALVGRWYWIAAGVILGGLASAYYLSKAPRTYSATCSLLIKQRTAEVMTQDRVDEIDMRTVEGLNTVAERIRRHDLLTRVASRTDVRNLQGLMAPAVDWTPGWFRKLTTGSQTDDKSGGRGASVPTPVSLASTLGSWMRVSIRRGTRLIDITFQHQVPEVAKALADAVAREYLAEISSVSTEGRTTQSEALLKQSEEVRAKIQTAQGAMATYIRALEVQRLLEIQEKAVDQLSRRYKPKYPKMAAALTELAQTREQFIKEFDLAMSSSSDAEYWKTAKVQLDEVKDDAEKHLRLARQLLLARASVLEGETKSQMTVFNAILTKIGESNVNRQNEAISADIHSFARSPGHPSAPIPSKVIGQGCGGGLVAGILLALVLVRRDNKFHSVAQLESEVNLPTLAAISNIELTYLDQAVKAAAKHGELEEPNPQQAMWDPLLVFRPGTSFTSFAEMFRILRASVSLLGDESLRKVTLFTSSLPGEGKSLVSSNFALAAAGQGRRTLLIDLDLRKPNVHNIFGFGRADLGIGITEWLAGQARLEDVISKDVGVPNLHVILCGSRAPNPGELLDSAKLRHLFARACEMYDMVVVDTAPLLAVPDTRIIAPLVDNFCLVVRAEYVPKGAVFRALEMLDSAGTPPSGMVFNGFKESRRLVGENYSYGYYRLGRGGRTGRYGYGAYGSYGAYGADEDEQEKRVNRRKKRRKQAG